MRLVLFFYLVNIMGSITLTEISCFNKRKRGELQRHIVGSDEGVWHGDRVEEHSISLDAITQQPNASFRQLLQGTSRLLTQSSGNLSQ